MATEPIQGRTCVGLVRLEDGGFTLEYPTHAWDVTYDRSRFLVLDHGRPIAWLDTALGGRPPTEVLPHRLSKIHVPHTTHHSGDNHVSTQTLAIAICTRNRADQLQRCLERLASGPRAADYEILVIDNAPDDNSTKYVVDAFASRGLPVHREVEKRPGLSRARNLALQRTEAQYIAFTDDDTLPDRDWAYRLSCGCTGDDSVAVVTGLVAPAELETPAQIYFERAVEWSTRLHPETMSMENRADYDKSFPYSASHLGAGANFAIRREVALELGGFDEALGAGTLSASGEDTEMFVRALRRGHSLRYEPSAIVWHRHRRSSPELRRLMFAYGSGVSATSIAEFLNPGKRDMIKGSLAGARDLISNRKTDNKLGTPIHLTMIEGAGALVGPAFYLLTRLGNRIRGLR